MSSMGFCVGSRLKRFLIVSRWRENLSSGEKRAGKGMKSERGRQGGRRGVTDNWLRKDDSCACARKFGSGTHLDVRYA